MSKPTRLVKLVLPLVLGVLGACHAGGRVGPVHAGGGVTANSPAKTNVKTATPDKAPVIAQNR